MKNLLLTLFLLLTVGLVSAQWTPSPAGASDEITNTNSQERTRIVSTVGAFKQALFVDKNNNSAQGKNIATFRGNASNPANPDANISLGVWQTTNEDGNYGLLNFFNSPANQSAFLGCRYVSHGANQSEFVFGTANGALPQTRMTIRPDGAIGVGTPLSSNPNGYLLAVNGLIGAKEVRVENTSTTWPDYVFASDYPLLTLNELEKYIKQNKHLPGIPSASNIEEEGGFKLGEMNVTLLEKIEELTLYLIETNKQNEALQKEINELTERVKELEGK